MRFVLSQNPGNPDLSRHVSEVARKLYAQVGLIREFERLSQIPVEDRTIADRIKLWAVKDVLNREHGANFPASTSPDNASEPSGLKRKREN